LQYFFAPGIRVKKAVILSIFKLNEYFSTFITCRCRTACGSLNPAVEIFFVDNPPVILRVKDRAFHEF